MSAIVVFAAEVGWRALLLMYIWLGSAIIAAEFSRSKGYGEKPGLGTGLILSALAPIVWLFIPPKDDLAEWHRRKPWQRRGRVKESEMEEMHTPEFPLEEETGSGTSAVEGGPGAGSRPGESRGT